MTDQDHILFDIRGALGVITLNRPDRLNALSQQMIERFTAQLDQWRADASVAAVAVQGAGAAFCAGGDIREVAAFGPENVDKMLDFFTAEYRLNRAVKTFPKPYVAFMDGVVMGGGAGVSAHGRYRVGGDATKFAMPETGIGLVPDIGSSFFLPRLPRRIGLWLALTGARLGPAEAMAANVVDYWTPSARHATVLDALAAADLAGDAADEAICEVLALNAVAPPPADFKPHLDEMDDAFSADTLEGVLAALDGGSDWAKAQAAEIRSKCPFSTKLAFAMLSRAAPADVDAALIQEYRCVRACLQRGDFFEGVRAAVIDKDGAAKWSPDALEAVDMAQIEAALAQNGPDLSF